MALTCDPNELALAAKCFQCLDDKSQKAIELYLMALIAGVTPDPDALQESAKDFKGIGKGQWQAMMAYLTCQAVNACTPSTPCTPDIQWLNGILVGDNFELTVQNSIQSLNFPGLISVTGNTTNFLIHANTGMLSVSLPALDSITNTATFQIYGNHAVTTASLPLLTNLGAAADLEFSDMPALTSLNVSSLGTIGDGAFMYLQGPSLVTSLDLGALTSVGAGATVGIFNNQVLASIQMNNVVFGNNVTLNLAGNALNQSTVDAALSRAVASPLFVAGSIDLSGGTNSAPSIAGAADVVILQGRGIVVATN